MIHTLLLFSIKIFDTRNFLKHRKVPLRHFSLLETKILTEKRDTPPSSLIHTKFRYPMFFETQTCSPTKLLDSVGQKLFAENSGIPFLSVFFFDTRLFLKHRRVLLRILMVLWDKKLDRNSWKNPSSLFHYIFWYLNFSRTQKVYPTMFFGTVRHQLFDGNLWCPLFPLSLKFFDARNFLKHRRDHL